MSQVKPWFCHKSPRSLELPLSAEQLSQLVSSSIVFAEGMLKSLVSLPILSPPTLGPFFFLKAYSFSRRLM